MASVPLMRLESVSPSYNQIKRMSGSMSGKVYMLSQAKRLEKIIEMVGYRIIGNINVKVGVTNDD